ncbi:MAG: restriction endonuclease [Candidatus Helarchaeota archaeon]
MENKSLRELVDIYFRKNGYSQIDYDYNVDNHHKFDIIITEKRPNEMKEKKIGIFVCDIHRSIGLNVLRKIQHMLEDAEEIDEAILVGKNFSSQVRKFYKSYDVKLLSQSEIKRDMEFYYSF